MREKAKECPLCGRESLLPKSGEYWIRHPKTNTIVARVPDLEWEECFDCGEHFLDDKAISKVEEEKYRSRGLLLPRELKTIRKSFGLTQLQMAKALDVGEKTYCRWENGLSMQTKALDRFVRLMAQNPKGLLKNKESEREQAGKIKSVKEYLEKIKWLSGSKFALASYGRSVIGDADKEMITKTLRRKKEENGVKNNSREHR